MQFTNKETKVDADNVKYFDLSQSSSSYLERKAGGTLKEGQYYTHAYVLKWHTSDETYRTLFKHEQDRCAVVKQGSNSLGMYSNRNGEFRDSGYDIVPQQDHWEVVVVTGAGKSSTGYAGTTSFYTMDASTGNMILRGTADRVCSGMKYFRIGQAGQPVGKVARVVSWKRLLAMNEIQALGFELTRKYSIFIFPFLQLYKILAADSLPRDHMNSIIHEHNTLLQTKCALTHASMEYICIRW